MRIYRFSYNLFSVISFIPILWLMVALPDRTIYQIPVPWIYLSFGGQLLAAMLLVVGVLQTDTLSFVGLSSFLREKSALQSLSSKGCIAGCGIPCTRQGYFSSG